jgi:hypothetical protein
MDGRRIRRVVSDTSAGSQFPMLAVLLLLNQHTGNPFSTDEFGSKDLEVKFTSTSAPAVDHSRGFEGSTFVSSLS